MRAAAWTLVVVVVVAAAAAAAAAAGETCDGETGTCGAAAVPDASQEAWDAAGRVARGVHEEVGGADDGAAEAAWRLLAGAGGPPLAEFLAESWQRRVAVFRGVSTAQAGLIPMRALSLLVDTGSSVFEAPRSGAPPDSRDFKVVKRVLRHDGWWTGEHPPPPGGVSARFVDGAMQRGHSLLANRLNFRWEPVARLAYEVSDRLFGSLVNVNAYLTPAGAQAFEAHADWMESFVLQLRGEKRWRLYGSPVVAPRPDQRERPAEELVTADRVSRELVLRPGDVLYLPSGVLHEAEVMPGAGGPSLHVTVGVELGRLHTWHGLAVEVLRRAAEADAAAAAAAGAAGEPPLSLAAPVPRCGGDEGEWDFTWEELAQVALVEAASRQRDFSLRLSVPPEQWRRWWAERDERPGADAVRVTRAAAAEFRRLAAAAASSATVRRAAGYLREEADPVLNTARPAPPDERERLLAGAQALADGLGADLVKKILALLRAGAATAPACLRRPDLAEGLAARLGRLADATDAELGAAAAGLVDAARSTVAEHLGRQREAVEEQLERATAAAGGGAATM